MATEALYFKEREGVLHNPIGQLSSNPSPALWWTAGYGGHSIQPSSSSMERTLKQVEQGSKESAGKGTVTQFTISPGDNENSGDALKSQAALPEHCSRFELGFGQPLVMPRISAKYPYADPCYGFFSTHGAQIPGRIMLPLDLGTNDVPIFVNPKQYHAIMKSRERRAKTELKNKATRARKPYMHESRHLHAMRRPRGCGGRFLNMKNPPNGKGESNPRNDSKLHPLSQSTGSQSSEVLQSSSGSGTLSSPRGTNGSITSLSVCTEVTSNTYAPEGVGRFRMNNLIHQPLHFLPVSSMIDTGHSIVMPSTWVAAADNCHDLKV